MTRHAFAALLAVSLGAASTDAQTPARVAVHVDPRVELVTLVTRLADYDEYRQTSADSAYAREVDQHFGAFKSHAAIALARRLRAERGISFDAIPSLAVHLVDVKSFAEKLPFEPRPERLDDRWKTAEAREFVAALKSFAADSKFQEFFDAHADYYARVESRLAAGFADSHVLEWFDGFFGAKQGAYYTAIPGLLCGGNNFGVGVRYATSKPEEIMPIFGCRDFDAQGLPVFGDGMAGLIAHELCHSYTNLFVEKYLERLRPSGVSIYSKVAQRMQRQGYGEWRAMMYESLVRACVVQYLAATVDAKAAEAEIKSNVSAGFLWIGDLSRLLDEYVKQRAAYGSFDGIMPRIIEFFDRLEPKLAAQLAAVPRVLDCGPASGAKDVDPKLEQLTVRFDRPMIPTGWSFVGAKDDTPEVVGEPKFDAEARVLTATVKLKAVHRYHFSLNGGRFQGFKSKDGVALEPYEIEFTTRD